MARSRAARLGQAVLDLVIDDSKFHSKISGAYKAAQNFTSQTGSNLTKAGRAISGVGESMTRNVTLPIVAAGGAVAKFGLDFDTTLRQVVGLTDVTQDEIAGIRGELMKLGPEVGKSPQELAEAFYFVASAGFEADEAMDVLRTSAKAAATGLGETQSVAQVLGSVINAYGKENITAARAADILVEAISQGTAEAPEFASVIGRVVPTAATLGVTFDQVAASIAGMTLTGLSAEESATSLNQVLVSLLKPTGQAEKAMEGLGLSSAGLRKQLREEGLLATLRTLEERFAGNEEAAAAVFGNVRALRGVTSLLALDSDQLNGVFGKVNDSLGRLEQGYKDTEGPQREIDRSMADLQATAIELGTDVLPLVVDVLREVADMARGLARWWGTLDDDTKQLVIRSAALIAVLGPVLIVVGKLTTGVGKLVKVVAFLGGPAGLARLGPAFSAMLGPLGLAIGAVAALAVGLSKLGEALDPDTIDVRDMLAATGDMGDAMDQLKAIAEETGEDWFDVGVRVRDAMEEMGLSFDQAVRHVRGTSDEQRAVLEQSGRDWEAYQQQISGAAEAGAEGAADALEELPPELVTILEEAGVPIGNAADATMGEIDEAAAAAREAAIGSMRSMLQGISNLFETDESLRDAWQALIDRMDDPYTEAERKADIFSQNTIDNIRAAIQSGDPDVAGDATLLVENMLAQIALMEPGALESGEAVPPAIRTGMDTEMSALIDWIETNVTGEALSAMSLENAREVGIEGIWKYNEGMLANQRAASTAAERVGRAALDSLIDEQSWTSSGRTIVDLIANGVDERTWRLQSAVRGAAQAARIVLPDSEPKDPHSPLRGLGHTGEALVDMVAGGVLGNLGTARSAMYALADVLTPTVGSWQVPTIATPALPGLAEMAGTSTAADGLGATVEHREYHLHYNGRDTLFGNPGAFLRELEELDRFDEEGV